jgi:hypothetical protein
VIASGTSGKVTRKPPPSRSGVSVTGYRIGSVLQA